MLLHIAEYFLRPGNEKLTQCIIGSSLCGDEVEDTASWMLIIEDFDSQATGILAGEFDAKEGRKVLTSVLFVTKSDEEARCNALACHTIMRWNHALNA